MTSVSSQEFEPDLSPKQMLELGVFSGTYFTEAPDELPQDWFKNAKLSPDGKPSYTGHTTVVNFSCLC